MLSSAVENLAYVILYAVIGGLAGWSAADIATAYGAFGSCFEGGCGYGAVLLGFPAFWLVFFVLLFMSRDWRLGWFSRGWRAGAAAVLIFPIVALLGFALMLGQP